MMLLSLKWGAMFTGRLIGMVLASLWWWGAVVSGASAHPADEGVVVVLTDVAALAEGSDARILRVFVGNRGGGAVTLRGFEAEGYDIVFERKRGVFGFESWVRVDFLRLEAGQARLLDEPAYRVIAFPEDGAAPYRGSTLLSAQFGPAGVYAAPSMPQLGGDETF